MILDAAHAAFDFRQQTAADIPPPTLAHRGKAGLADPASNPQFANLRTDDVFGSGRHGCEPRA